MEQKGKVNDMDITAVFLDNAFYLMEKRQVNMAEVHEYLGVSNNYLYQARKRGQHIPLDKAYDLAEYLETTLNVLTDKHMKTNMIVAEKKRKIEAMRKEIAKLEEEIKEVGAA